jgi:hypothetical protein
MSQYPIAAVEGASATASWSDQLLSKLSEPRRDPEIGETVDVNAGIAGPRARGRRVGQKSCTGKGFFFTSPSHPRCYHDQDHGRPDLYSISVVLD